MQYIKKYLEVLDVKEQEVLIAALLSYGKPQKAADILQVNVECYKKQINKICKKICYIIIAFDEFEYCEHHSTKFISSFSKFDFRQSFLILSFIISNFSMRGMYLVNNNEDIIINDIISVLIGEMLRLVNIEYLEENEPSKKKFDDKNIIFCNNIKMVATRVLLDSK